ncbi:MAG: hypothetical protein D6701_14375 [Gemmatimonadetes bacterium]|nr:MAG: hypothetical protein D6701_14375 [Gemmatimonadota bacterium]
MSTGELHRDDLLDESEATLRQVSSVISELTSEGDVSLDDPENLQRVLVTGEGHRPATLGELLHAVFRAYQEIASIIESLRESRGLLEKAAMERLHRTNHKLREVTSATELAATDMLDGLDRALSLVDRLTDSDDGEAQEALREELHGLINLLQFQDITSQQLGYASGVLTDIEERLLRISRVFDLSGLREVGVEPPETVEIEADACDPEASTFEAESRQALADEIFTP